MYVVIAYICVCMSVQKKKVVVVYHDSKTATAKWPFGLVLSFASNCCPVRQANLRCADMRPTPLPTHSHHASFSDKGKKNNDLQLMLFSLSL